MDCGRRRPRYATLSRLSASRQRFSGFLNPKTKEEYALARTERKSSAGYTGFICDFSPTITLEQDLIRRDLTINAMAQSEDGEIIDPYGGKQDLENRIYAIFLPLFQKILYEYYAWHALQPVIILSVLKSPRKH